MRRSLTKNVWINVFITIIFSFVFVSCSLFQPNDVELYRIPNVQISAEASNITTKDKVSLKAGDDIQNVQTNVSVTINGKVEIIQVDNSIKVLYCKGGDEIIINYFIQLQEQSASLKFDMLETKVFGFDWEQNSDLTTFTVNFLVPELPSGKYPITSETMYKIDPTSSFAGTISLSPITCTLLLIVQ